MTYHPSEFSDGHDADRTDDSKRRHASQAHPSGGTRGHEADRHGVDHKRSPGTRADTSANDNADMDAVANIHTHAEAKTSADTAIHTNAAIGALPHDEADVLRDFIATGWPLGTEDDSPTFLWNEVLDDLAVECDATRLSGPVAPFDQARAIMRAPIDWYFQSLAASVPDTQLTPEGYAMRQAALPTFHIETRALSGVQAVAGNAMMSDHWQDAAANLAAALEVTAEFIGNIADREDEGFVFLKRLIQDIRVYFESLARSADPITGAASLQAILDVVCSEDFRLNPTQMVELLSCALPFARWDDTRVLAYDALDKASGAMDRMLHQAKTDVQTDLASGLMENADGDLVDYPIELVHMHFEQTMLFLRHDLLRLSGEAEAADRFLAEHHDMEPFADSYAARLIAQERWQELLDFSELVMRDDPNQQLMVIPSDVAPYEWESIHEAALQALGRREELCELYRERVVEAFDSDEVFNVSRLRAASGDDWPRQVKLILEEYDDGREHFTRNMAYEQLLISEKLGERAWRYARQFPKSRTKLAKTIALARPETAKHIILGPIGMDGSYEGEMPARQAAYQHIAKSLMKYASVFSMNEAQSIARKLVEHYPARAKLAQALYALLETEG
jgi:hypothetical protein